MAVTSTHGTTTKDYTSQEKWVLHAKAKPFLFSFLLSSSFHFCLRDNMTGLYITAHAGLEREVLPLQLKCWAFGITTTPGSKSFGFITLPPHFMSYQSKPHLNKPAATVSGSPADAVPRTTGWVFATLTSQIPSLWPIYSFTSWQMALDVVVLKLETI